MFRKNSETEIHDVQKNLRIYSEIYHEMANKCPDQSSAHRKKQKEFIMIQYWFLMTLRSGYTTGFQLLQFLLFPKAILRRVLLHNWIFV